MKRIIPVFLIVLITLLASCGQKYSYTDIIPKDASMVISVDFEQLYLKSNIDKTENGKKLKAQLDHILKDFFSNLNEEDVNALIQNPNQSGLDFTEKGYIFVGRESKTYGLVFKVSDKKKILKFDLPENNISFKKEQDFYTCVSDNFIIVFDNTAFLVLSSNYPVDESLLQYAFSLMEENKEKETPIEMKSLFEKENDLSAYIDMNFIPNGALASARMGLSGDLLLKDLKFITSANIEKGKIDLILDNITDNPSLVDLFEKYSKVFSPMSDKFLDMFPSSTLMYGGTHLNGSALHQLLQENPAISYALTNSDFPLDMNRVLSSIQGDLTVGIHSINNKSFSLYAEVTDSFMEESLNELQTFVASAHGMAAVQKVKENLYLFQAYPDMRIWFGSYRNVFFMTNNSYCASNFGEPYKASLKQKQWAKNVHGNAISAAFDVGKLLKDADVSPFNETAMALYPFEYINFYAKEWNQFRFELVTKDKERNILEQAIDLISNLY